MPTKLESTASPESKRPTRLHNVRMLQNFHLVWLDGSINEINNEDCRNSIMKLRQIVNTINTFVDADDCIDFITDYREKVAMIISGQFSQNQNIISIVQDIPQVNSIYLLGYNHTEHEEWEKQRSKVQGVYIDISHICEALEKAVKHIDHNSVPISFIKPTDGDGPQDLDTLDQSFMYSQVLKNTLLSINFGQIHFDEFITYCREQLVENIIELKNVDKFQKEYHHYPSIWWYTSSYFFYSMLNRALRTMEIDIIIKMGFFIRHLHNHITALHSEQYSGSDKSKIFIVYRGQGLSKEDFNKLQTMQGGLIAFNNFLSTSLDRRVSLTFAESITHNPDLIGILFEININLSISSSPFANISHVSHFREEEEILFSMHTVFRIGMTKQIDKNDRLWQVNLTLTADNDPTLYAVTKCIENEIYHSTGWIRLGLLMLKVGQYNTAEKLYNTLLTYSTPENIRALIFDHLGVIKFNQGCYIEALSYYTKELEIREKLLPYDDSYLVTCYNNTGLVYNNMGDYSKALSYYTKALEIQQKKFAPNHPELGTLYCNIGLAYTNMNECSKGLPYYEKSLEIVLKNLPQGHPSVATSYNNIAFAYIKMCKYSTALPYLEKVLQIRAKILPPYHPRLGTAYNNKGIVYYEMHEYSKALPYFEKALEIEQKSHPQNHPNLVSTIYNIGKLYKQMDDYFKALPYFEKVLEIKQKTLPKNHPDLADINYTIGQLHKHMREYSKAITYYEKGLEIDQKTIPSNHSRLNHFLQQHWSIIRKHDRVFQSSYIL